MSETNYNQKKSVFFKPWIGENYHTTGLYAKRVLIVGESHYFKNGTTPTTDFTTVVIQEIVNEEWTHPFFTKLVRVFMGYPSYERLSQDKKKAFFNSVAFFNFIQDKTIRQPRVAPTEPMWEIGRRAFKEVIDRLTPQCCIVLGYRLWEQLPNEGERGQPIQDGHRGETWYYSHNRNRVLCYPIYHPSSSRFSPNEWHPFIRDAIEMS